MILGVTEVRRTHDCKQPKSQMFKKKKKNRQITLQTCLSAGIEQKESDIDCYLFVHLSI